MNAQIIKRDPPSESPTDEGCLITEFFNIPDEEVSVARA